MLYHLWSGDFCILTCQSQKTGRNSCRGNLDHLMTSERKKTTQPLEDNKAINVKADKQILQRYTEQL